MNSMIDPQDPLRDQIAIRSDEGEDSRMYPGEELTAGWPGDGSGEDDLADMNANEVDDYRDEGGDESINEDYEGYYEDVYEAQYEGENYCE